MVPSCFPCSLSLFCKTHDSLYSLSQQSLNQHLQSAYMARYLKENERSPDQDGSKNLTFEENNQPQHQHGIRYETNFFQDTGAKSQGRTYDPRGLRKPEVSDFKVEKPVNQSVSTQT